MIQMMMATIGSPAASHAARGAPQRTALIWRKTVGFAIVTSGFAVVVAQALQHTLGG
jgi:hypothetical protein